MKNRYFSDSPASSNTFLFSRISFALLIPALLLVLLSLVTFYSLDMSLFRQQLVYLIAAVITYFIFLNIDYKIFGYFSKIMYAVMVGLLVLLFIIGIEAKGAVRWIDIFGIRIQFSEIFKPFFIIFMARFLSQNESRSFSKFLQALILLFPVFFLTLKQPDLGNALIYLFTTLAMLLMYGFPIKYFVGLALALIIPFPLFFSFLHDYQKNRILSFMNSSHDPSGSSYNAIQALISVGSGKFMGKGLGQATQSILRFLPERHTDFIFATISESMGFVGGLILLTLYGYLLYKIYKISTHVTDAFSYLIVVGCYFLLLIHVFFNIGMNTGIVPIVGITLPLVSYGGSSLLTNFVLLGIVSSISFEFKKRQSFEIS